MGNRAVITTEHKEIAIYLHWNGGIESVLAFLAAARSLGVRDPSWDPSYGLARLTQVIGMFFSQDGEYATSLGICTYASADTDNGDNGTYIIGNGFEIVERLYSRDQTKIVENLNPDQMSYYKRIYDTIMEASKKMTRDH